MTEIWKEALKMQYLAEKQILERRHNIVVTFEEWLEMKQKTYEWIKNS